MNNSKHTHFKKICYTALSLLLVLSILVEFLPMIPALEAEADTNSLPSSIDDPSIFYDKQSKSKCTMYSVLYMLRRGAIINGDTTWADINESNNVSNLWGGSGQLDAIYPEGGNIHGMTIGKKYPPSNVDDKIQFVKDQLKEHPEGIVIYCYQDDSRCHAVLAVGFDSDGTILCVDPANTIPSGVIRLTDSYFTKYWGKTQSSLLKYYTKSWYVKSGISYCDHDWVDAGICSKCSAVYNYGNVITQTDNNPTDSSYPKNFRPGWYQTIDSVYVSKTPYGGDQKTSEKLNKGAQVIIDGFVKNAYGKIWYKLHDHGEGGWVQSTHFGSRLDKTDNIVSNITLSTGTIKLNATHTYKKIQNLNGVIKSNNEIYSIQAVMHDVTDVNNFYPFIDTGDILIPGNVTEYSLYNSPVDKALPFNSLKINHRYQLELYVVDIYGIPQTFSSDYFLVTDGSTGSGSQTTKPVCTTPYESDISREDQCKKVWIAAGAGTVYYTTDGSTPTTRSSTAMPIVVTNSTHIRAIATRNGYSNSAEFDRWYYIDTVGAPTPNVSYTSSGASVSFMRDDLEDEIYYSFNYNGPYSKYAYPSYVNVSNSCTVYAYSKRAGMRNSEIVQAYVDLSAPGTPTASLTLTNSKIAVGQSASLKWNNQSRADYYTVRLYKDGSIVEEKNSKGTIEAFILNEAGVYSMTVQARNDRFGNSDESNAVTVEAMPPVTVTFKDDYDGTVLSTQTIDYGADAQRPTAPPHRGYTFEGWNRSFENVTKDIEVIAEYKIITYTVRIYDTNGIKLLESQKVDFGHPVDLAAAQGKVAVDDYYVFTGWRIEQAADDSELDITAVDSDMKLVAVTRWENQDLPVGLEIISADRQSEGEGYNVTVKLTCADMSVISDYTKKVKVVAAAKSSEDKMLACSISTLNLEESVRADHTMFISYDGSALADRIEVTVLGITDNSRTGTVLSETKSVKPGIDVRYNDWSTERPTGVSDDQIQTKIQYRYRDNIKKTTTSTTTKNMSGWIYSYSDSRTGSWSSWSSSYVSKVNTDALYREVVTREVPVVYKQQYRYGAWADVNDRAYNRTYCPNQRCPSNPGKFQLEYSDWSDTRVSPIERTEAGWYCKDTITSHNHVHPMEHTNGKYYWYGYKAPLRLKYYWEETRDVPIGGGYTEYQYRDTTYTHHFYQWAPGDTWSEWSDTEYIGISTSSQSRDVETQTMYRCQISSSEVTPEDTSGEFVNISGSLSFVPEDLQGKEAVLMVYKELNTDPTEAQLEYIGTTTLGRNNSYSFDFKTREMPSEATGDFIVSIALEGTTNLLNIDRIGADHSCRVSYIVNGELYDEQTVDYGGAVTPPDAPTIEGSRFVLWSGQMTNITRDTSLTAIYVPESHSVAFVDWANDTVASLQRADHGSTLFVPVAPEAEGRTFVGWKASDGSVVDENTVVTEDMIIEADYDVEAHTVNFYDVLGEIIETQDVEYGGCATLPDYSDSADKVFLGWSTNASWWNVTQDIDVYPLMAYPETAAAPVSNIGDGVNGANAVVELSSEIGAKIYYTTDGTEPDEFSIEYTEPFVLTESAVVNAIAVVEGKNVSDVTCIDVYCNDSFVGTEDYGDIVEVDTRNVYVESNDVVELTVSVENNPGIAGCQFFVECDRSVFYVDYDYDELEYDFSYGNVTEDGTMFAAAYGDNGYQLLWYNTESVSDNGTLFTIRLHAGDDITAGNYPIKVSYSPQNTITANEMENELKPQNINVSTTADVTIGDANGDDKTTLADVILISRSIVGLSEITAENKAAADVNGDGKVTNADVILLARYIAGLEETIG